MQVKQEVKSYFPLRSVLTQNDSISTEDNIEKVAKDKLQTTEDGNLPESRRQAR